MTRIAATDLIEISSISFFIRPVFRRIAALSSPPHSLGMLCFDLSLSLRHNYLNLISIMFADFTSSESHLKILILIKLSKFMLSFSNGELLWSSSRSFCVTLPHQHIFLPRIWYPWASKIVRQPRQQSASAVSVFRHPIRMTFSICVNVSGMCGMVLQRAKESNAL